MAASLVRCRVPRSFNRGLQARLRAFAAEGVGHVQLVLDPINADTIAALAPTLALLDA